MSMLNGFPRLIQWIIFGLLVSSLWVGLTATDRQFARAEAHTNTSASTAVQKPATVQTPPRAPAKPATKPVAAKAAAKTTAVPPASRTPVDFEKQITDYYCGPASTRIALTARGKPVSQDNLAGQLGTTTEGTNSSYEIERVLDKVLGQDKYVTRTVPSPEPSPAQTEQLKRDVVNSIKQDYVVVANITGAAEDLRGNQYAFEGHYITVVGYSDYGRVVHIADPAPNTVDYYSMTADELSQWIAERGYNPVR